MAYIRSTIALVAEALEKLPSCERKDVESLIRPLMEALLKNSNTRGEALLFCRQQLQFLPKVIKSITMGTGETDSGEGDDNRESSNEFEMENGIGTRANNDMGHKYDKNTGVATNNGGANSGNRNHQYVEKDVESSGNVDKLNDGDNKENHDEHEEQGGKVNIGKNGVENGKENISNWIRGASSNNVHGLCAASHQLYLKLKKRRPVVKIARLPYSRIATLLPLLNDASNSDSMVNDGEIAAESSIVEPSFLLVPAETIRVNDQSPSSTKKSGKLIARRPSKKLRVNQCDEDVDYNPNMDNGKDENEDESDGPKNSRSNCQRRNSRNKKLNNNKKRTGRNKKQRYQKPRAIVDFDDIFNNVLGGNGDKDGTGNDECENKGPIKTSPKKKSRSARSGKNKSAVITPAIENATDCNNGEVSDEEQLQTSDDDELLSINSGNELGNSSSSRPSNQLTSAKLKLRVDDCYTPSKEDNDNDSGSNRTASPDRPSTNKQASNATRDPTIRHRSSSSSSSASSGSSDLNDYGITCSPPRHLAAEDNKDTGLIETNNAHVDLQEEGEPEDSSDSDESLGLTCSPPSSPLPQNDTFPVNNDAENRMSRKDHHDDDVRARKAKRSQISSSDDSSAYESCSPPRKTDDNEAGPTTEPQNDPTPTSQSDLPNKPDQNTNKQTGPRTSTTPFNRGGKNRKNQRKGNDESVREVTRSPSPQPSTSKSAAKRPRPRSGASPKNSKTAKNESNNSKSFSKNKANDKRGGSNGKKENTGLCKKVTCPTCNANISKNNIARHLRVVHLQPDVWDCECGKSIKRYDNYVQHLRTHEDEHMQKCKFCKRFKVKTYMPRHEEKCNWNPDNKTKGKSNNESDSGSEMQDDSENDD